MIFQVDCKTVVPESDETNNEVAVAISIGQPQPDLAVANLLANPDTVQAGTNIDLSYRIDNSGDGDAGISTGCIYLSADNVLDGADVLLVEPVVPGIISGDQAELTETITIPAATLAGDYFLIIEADCKNEVAESNEANNTDAIGITVNQPLADLVITDPLITPNAVIAGGNTSAGYIFVNQGQGDALASTICFFLSTDNTLDPADVSLGEQAATGLAAGDTRAADFPLPIPAGTAAGDYFVIFQVDCKTVVPESDETNNEVAVAISIGQPQPDLAVANLLANPDTVQAGTNIDLSYRIDNSGDGDAGISTGCIYLSADNVLDGADVLLVEPVVPGIISGDQAELTETITIPAATLAGDYFLIIEADCKNEVAESNEANNTDAIGITVNQPLADLVITDPLITPNAVIAGGNTSAGYIFVNQGQGDALASTICFFLSTDNILDPADVSLGEQAATGLAAGDTRAADFPLPIPAGTAAGDYFVIFQVDCKTVVPESDETNNEVAVAISIGQPQPDLAVANLLANPDTVQAGTNIDLSYRIDNSGDGDAGISTGCIYLSADNVLDGADVLLVEPVVPGIISGDQAELTETITIPAATLAGDYFLIIEADCKNEVAESNEANNTDAIGITVNQPLADLVITDPLITPNAVIAGGNTSAGYIFVNQGQGDALASTICFFLSTDNTLDPADVSLGEQAATGLAAGDTRAADFPLPIPAGTAAGDYFVIFQVDCKTVVPESDETNNEVAVAISIGQPQPDLAVANLLANPDTVQAGTNIDLSYRIDNSGDGDAGISTGCIYLSADNVLDGADVLLVEPVVPGIISGDQAELTETITIPAATLAGDYFLIIEADCKNEVAESNEANNTDAIGITVNQPLADLVITDPLITPNAVIAGGNTSAGYIFVNQGQGDALASTICFFLSTDNTLDPADVSLGEQAATGLAAGDTRAADFPLPIPAGTAAGDYFVIFQVDCKTVVPESDETNNEVAVAISIGQPQPDLAVANLLANPDTVQAGTNIDLSYRIDNSGDGDAGISTGCIYLSADNVLDGADVLLVEPVVPGIISGDQAELTETITIPAATLAGDYFLIIEADCKNEVAESNEANNTDFVAITVNQPLPDLTATDATALPAAISAGDLLQINFTLNNLSQGNAPQSFVCYYLSEDQLLNVAEDELLGQTEVGAMNANEFIPVNSNLNIPFTIIPGEYFILIDVNCNRIIEESDTTNNLTVVPFIVDQPQPDLTISNVASDTSTYLAGETMSISYDISNTGEGDANTSEICFFLSTDSVLDVSTDRSIAEKIIPGITLDQTLPQSIVISLPGDVEPGIYFVHSLVDCENVLAELNEDNNTAYFIITVGQPQPDLAVANLLANPDTVQAGTNIDLSYRIDNSGDGDAGISTGCIYLSADNVLDGADVLLVEPVVPGIISGDQAELTETITIPAATLAGDYFLIIEADCKNEVAESNEANNTDFVAITVNQPLPDLTATDATALPAAISAGDLLQINFTLNNLSQGNAPQSFVCYYLSEDQLLNVAEDELLGQTEVGAMNANEFIPVNSNLNIPFTIIPGEYFILIDVNCNRIIEESDTTNNLTVVPFIVDQPQPDLTISNVASDTSTYLAGETMSISYDISNTGEGDANTSEICFFLSTDSVLDVSTDRSIAEKIIPGITLDQTLPQSIVISLPGDVEPGIYFVHSLVDCENVLAELNEDNNTAYFAITISQPKPDLIIQTPSVEPVSAFSGDSVLGSFAVINQGQGTSVASKVCVYLSENNQFEIANDVLLGETSIDNILPEGNQAINLNLPIPVNTLSGSYFVLFVADCENVVDEIEESNNIATTTITITTPESDLIVENISVIPDSVGAGDEVSLTYDISNIGLGIASQTDVCIYLSVNSTFEPLQDIPLRELPLEAIEGSGSFSLTTNATIPLSTVNGIYFLLIVADCGNNIEEGNENNNVGFTPIKVGDIPDGNVDLTITDPSALPGTVDIGDLINVSYQLTNLGDSTAANSTICIYLSDNTTLEAGTDILLGNDEAGSIQPAQSLAFSNDFVVPAGIDPGGYFILIVADCDSAVAEIDESNNISTVAISVGQPLADLVITDMDVSPDTLLVEETGSLAVQIENIGSGAAGPTTTCLFLSQNNTFEASEDVILISVDTDSLSAGNILALTENIEIPANTPSGRYFILAITDCLRNVQESNEENNVRAIPVVIIGDDPIDLSVQVAILDQNAVPSGSSVKATTTIANIGVGEAGNSTFCLFLSENDSLEENQDLKLAEEIVPPLTAPDEISIDIDFQIPGNIDPGEYTVIFVADCENSISEADELNNIRTSRITVVPPDGADLLIINHAVSQTELSSNEVFTTTFEVANIHPDLTTNPSISCIFLSKDPSFNPVEDDKLGEVSTIGLAAGDTTSHELQVSIPDGKEPGNYFILFVADCNNEISEDDERNNIARSSISITDENLPDLTVEEPELPNDIQPGSEIDTKVTIENEGERAASTFDVCVYLSQDDIFDSRDVFITEVMVDSAGIGEQVEVDVKFQSPMNIDSGDYFIFVADCEDLIGDADRSDNAVAIPIFVEDKIGCDDLGFTNMVTPNGDGVNDTWQIADLPLDNSIKIFDRWGNEIFRQSPYTNGWRGQQTGSGFLAKKGTYYYVLETNSDQCKGTITVLR